jgi:hypothetical protein
MRNAEKLRSGERDFLFGHVTYETKLWFSKTTRFCFQYHPPSNVLPESWSVYDGTIFPPK